MTTPDHFMPTTKPSKIEQARIDIDAIGRETDPGGASTKKVSTPDIAPSDHAKELQTISPALAKILLQDSLHFIANAYHDADQRSILLQSNFKKLYKRSTLTVFSTTIFGAAIVILGPSASSDNFILPIITRVVTFLGILSSITALAYYSQIRGGRFPQRWLSARLRAEDRRIEYFRTILKRASAEPETQLYAFEYARRFLLESQLAYFRSKRSQHEGQADSRLVKSIYGTSVATSLIGISATLSLWRPSLSVLAAIAPIASAYATRQKSILEMNQDRDNSISYLAVAERLDDHCVTIDECRVQIENNDPPGAGLAFFEKVFEILKADHDKFMKQMDLREQIISEDENQAKSGNSGVDNHSGPPQR